MDGTAGLWFLAIPAVLVAFVVFVICNTLFNPRPDTTAPGFAAGPSSSASESGSTSFGTGDGGGPAPDSDSGCTTGETSGGDGSCSSDGGSSSD